MNDKPMIDKSKVDKSMNDKLEQHHGLQLSALMDGELAPDEARFLLRRLQHDGELAGCWERWQLAGEVMRGRTGALLPDGFAGRVATALHAEVPAAPARRAPGLLRWGGAAALAASVAVVALMVPRPAPDPQVAGDAHVVVADAGQVPAPARAPEPDAAQAIAAAPAAVEPSAVESPVGASSSAPSARVLASNARSARAAGGDPMPALADPSSRGAASPERSVEAMAPISPPRLASEGPATQDPFSDAPLVSRPWPRAVLPQLDNGGVLATGLPGNNGSQAPSFYPFEPRLPAQSPEPAPESAPDPPQVPY